MRFFFSVYNQNTSAFNNFNLPGIYKNALSFELFENLIEGLWGWLFHASIDDHIPDFLSYVILMVFPHKLI